LQLEHSALRWCYLRALAVVIEYFVVIVGQKKLIYRLLLYFHLEIFQAPLKVYV
jgi:hypothetical protein